MPDGGQVPLLTVMISPPLFAGIMPNEVNSVRMGAHVD